MSANEEYIRLLEKRNDNLSKALVFYLTKKGIRSYSKKVNFVEKVVHAYIEFAESERTGKYLEISIPQEIIEKVILGYFGDLGKEKQKEKQQLIAEMNEIF